MPLIHVGAKSMLLRSQYNNCANWRKDEFSADQLNKIHMLLIKYGILHIHSGLSMGQIRPSPPIEVANGVWPPSGQKA